MLLRTHLVFSILIWLLVFDYLQKPFVFLLFMVFAVALVDIDSRKSKVGKKWYFRPLQWFVSHRGVFHSLIFGLIFSLVLLALSSDAGLGFFIGYSSHLFLDLFTKSGLKILWPFYNKRISFGFIRSGGLIEEILFVLMLLGDLGLGLTSIF